MTETPFKKVQLSERVLKAAEEITLRDLLDSPTAQCWIVSALGNQLRFAHLFEGSDTHMEEYLQFALNRAYMHIDKDEKQQLFEVTNTLIKSSKKEQLRKQAA